MTPSQAIKLLLEADLTEVEIAALVGSAQSTINRIRNGKSCRFELGVALIEAARRAAAARSAQAGTVAEAITP